MFASRPVITTRWYNKRILIKGYSVPRGFSWIWNCKQYNKGVLTNFAKFTAKHLCQSLFLNKVADWGCSFYSPSHISRILQNSFERVLLFLEIKKQKSAQIIITLTCVVSKKHFHRNFQNILYMPLQNVLGSNWSFA